MYTFHFIQNKLTTHKAKTELQKFKSEKKCVMKLLNKDGQNEGECMKEKQTSERKYWSAEGSERLQHWR